MRLIVSSIGSPTYYIAQHLTKIIATLVNRALTITEPNKIYKEKRKLRNALKKNRYSDEIITTESRKQDTKTNNRRTDHIETEDKKTISIIPFLKGTSEKITRTLRKNNIKTIFTTDRKIGQILPNLKDSLGLKKPGIYSIPCSCGKQYIGNISTRLKPAIAEHFHNTQHAIAFEDTKAVLTTNTTDQG